MVRIVPRRFSLSSERTATEVTSFLMLPLLPMLPVPISNFQFGLSPSLATLALAIGNISTLATLTTRFVSLNAPPVHSRRIPSVSITAPSPLRSNVCLTGGWTRLMKVRLGRSSNEPSSLHSQRTMRSVRSVKRALPANSVLPTTTAHDAAHTPSVPSIAAPAVPENVSVPVPTLANTLRETVSHSTPSPPLLAGTRFTIAFPSASSRRAEYHFAWQ